MGHAARFARWLLAGLATLVLVAAIAATWLVTTEAGLRRAVALAESIRTVRIRVEGARGRLIGPLSIAAVEIEHPRASIRVAGFEADYEPLEILAGRISAEGARIDDARIRLRPPQGPKRPPSFMPGGLTLVIDDFAVRRFAIVSQTGTETRFEDIRGSARLSSTRIAFERVHARSTGWAVAGASGTLFARDPLALDAQTAWSLGAGGSVGGIARASGDLGRLLVDARVAVPAIARVTAEVRDLATALSWRGKADVETLDLAQWMADPPFGPLSATLQVEGDRAQYAATGAVSGRGLPGPVAGVAAKARFSDQVLHLDALTLAFSPGSVLRAQGEMTLGDPPAFNVTASWSKLRWPLTGEALIASPSGSLTASGWTEFAYRVSGEFAPAAGPPFAGHATGQFTTAAIRVHESSWRALGGDLSIAGSLSRDDAKTWSFAGRARGIDPAGIRPDLPGRLDFEFGSAGRGFGAEGPWSASIRRLKGQFRGLPASGGGAVRREPGRVEFEDVSLALGPARLAADGVLGRGADLDARIVADDLSALMPELGGSLNATLSMRDNVIAVGFTGHGLAFGSHRAVVLSANARIDREGREHSWLRLRSNGITLGGFAISDTRLSLDGLAQDHSLAFRVGAGQDAVALRGRGAWAGGRYALRLENIAASGPRIVPWKLVSPSRIEASSRDATLEPVCLAYETRRFCLEGQWRSGGAWSVKAQTDGFPLEALDPKRLGAPRYRGMLAIDAEASGRAGQPWLADLRAEIRDASLAYQSASGAERTVALGLTRLTLVSEPARHRFDLRISDAADLDLAVQLEATRVPGRDLGELPVTGSVRGRTRQLTLLPLLVDAIDNASGEAALDFTVAGRVAAPVLNGEARLTGGTLDFYQANLRLRELRSTVRLRDTTLTLDAAGKAGDGTLAIDGRLGWRDRRLDGELTLRGDRLLVANVPEARVFASPDLRFRIDDRRIAVTGEVVIPEARIQPADTAGAVLPSSDERIVEPEAGVPGAEGFEVASDIRIRLGEKVAVKAYGLSATVAGVVRARTEPREATTGSGEFEVKEGEYKAYGRELEVERGRLVFTGGPVTDPGVDLRATRELPGYKVGVIARGPLRRPQLTLFSEPSLPQSQIASMLIIGRSSVQGDPGAAGDESPSTTEQGGAFLAGQLGKYVGLDDVGVTQDAETGTELVIGKYLSPRLYVSYGISLVEEINTLKLRYTIGDRWTVSAESGLEQALDIEYRIED